MREIHCSEITENIREMCIEATHFLSPDMSCALKNAVNTEQSPLGRQVLQSLEENLKSQERI